MVSYGHKLQISATIACTKISHKQHQHVFICSGIFCWKMEPAAFSLSVHTCVYVCALFKVHAHAYSHVCVRTC